MNKKFVKIVCLSVAVIMVVTFVAGALLSFI